MDEDEKFISGYCRTANMTRTVCCEYDTDSDIPKLTFMDCSFNKCEFHASCLIYQEAVGQKGLQSS